MADKHITGDVNVFTVGGSSILATFRGVEMELDRAVFDGTAIKVEGRQNQEGRASVTLRTGLMTTLSDGVRVSNLDCSAFEIGGVDYKPELKRLRFSGSMELEDTEGATGPWSYHQYMGKKDYSGEIELSVSNNIAALITGKAFSATYTDRIFNLGFTINGVAHTLRVLGHNWVHAFDEGTYQRFRVQWSGAAPDGSAQPAAPTGTTGIFNKALNAPGTELAFVLTSKTAGGVTYGGNAVFESMGFEIVENSIVSVDYTWRNKGAWTAVGT